MTQMSFHRRIGRWTPRPPSPQVDDERDFVRPAIVVTHPQLDGTYPRHGLDVSMHVMAVKERVPPEESNADLTSELLLERNTINSSVDVAEAGCS